MKINNIKATNIELTPDIADYVRRRIGMLDKVIARDDTSAWVSAEVGKTTQHHKEGDVFFAEFNVHVAGKDFRAVAEKDDILAAIDEAKDDLVREVSQHKNKQRTLVRRGGIIVKNILKGIGEVPGMIGGFSGRIGGQIGRGIKGIKSFRFRRHRK